MLLLIYHWSLYFKILEERKSTIKAMIKEKELWEMTNYLRIVQDRKTLLLLFDSP
jgi:hypothetical protein